VDHPYGLIAPFPSLSIL